MLTFLHPLNPLDPVNLDGSVHEPQSIIQFQLLGFLWGIWIPTIILTLVIRFLLKAAMGVHLVPILIEEEDEYPHLLSSCGKLRTFDS
ncbi:MAG: hypothetical protein NW237_00060 [Cyanobacteriota bacterium]|nr:hypothetical protein [Cyanobacteriota bacterium]